MRIDQFISGEAVDRLGDVLLLVGLDGSVLDANPPALDCYGYSRAEMLCLSIRDIRAPQDQEAIDSQMREAAGHGVLFEAQHRRGDGTVFPVEVRSVPVSIDGESALLSSVRDITERGLAEQALRESEAKFRALFEGAEDGIILISPNGTVLSLNAAFARMHGYTVEEMLSMNLKDIDTPESARLMPARLQRVFAGEPMSFEVEQYCRNGQTVPLEVTTNPVVIGDQTYALAFHRDITERKLAEQALRESELLYRALLEHASDAVYVFALSGGGPGRFLEVNNRACTMLGYTRDEFLDMEVGEIDVPEQNERIPAIMDRMQAEGSATFETEHVAKDGSRIPVEVSAALFEFQGAPTIVSTARDITERKLAREELQASSEELYASNEELQAANEELSETNLRLEEATRAKSEFLAAMSHELRTPLNSIIGFSGVLSQELAGSLNEEQRKQVGMINNSGRHLLELINEVLDLAKIEAGDKEPSFRKVAVCEVARQTFDTVRPMADAKGIEIRLTCPDGLTPILTDALHVNQILLNLLGNAVKFTENGCITTTISQDDSGVTITVEDSGAGISAADLKHVFDDFFQVTPKGGGKSEGTGLGLAISRRLAESIGARIEATSEPGHGSVFTLHIPGRPR